MAKIRSYTTIEQSKVLAEILPNESADMYYHNRIDIPDNFPLPIEWKRGNPLLSQEIPCWSFAALLYVLPDESDIVKGKVDVVDYKYMCTVCIKEEVVTTFGNNLLDACYEMILKLHELKML